MNKKIPLLLFSALILLGGHFGSQNVSQASTAGYSVDVAGPTLVSSFGEQLAAVIAGQQVMLALQLQGSIEEDFVAIIELRDTHDVTSEIIWKEGRLEANKPTDLRLPWKPQQAGDYSANAFVLSSLESPEILSEGSRSSIKVVASKAELDELVPVPPVKPPVTIEKEVPSGPAPYTFMVYMVASDLESNGYYATIDIMEMMSVGSTDNVNVVIQTGVLLILQSMTLGSSTLLKCSATKCCRMTSRQLPTLARKTWQAGPPWPTLFHGE